ncbi:erythromycin esterase family protein [Streptomyces sp. 7-21]|uniref:erythromycin esterase family protein n=1 Tax=Streptomyces sp. 7-21 TaxID=2802283 RepID=UPI00191FB142|nr:erythromycin esterase family protein [Streptomyces sp. 7-21]MBL1067454.1 erythromycin esterase family protein [Streptomyces sp. 7-21]
MVTRSTDIAHRVEAAAVMRLFPSRPRLLALGEPTHGEEALLRVRNELFRQLVEHEGYRTIALETDCLSGLLVDDYVTGGACSLDEAMARGFSHGWGAWAGNRALVRWMRAFNEGRPEADRVRFAGFDGPLEITGAASPRRALTGLLDYLAPHVDAASLPRAAAELDRLLGADARWTRPEAMRDPSRSVGQSPEAARLRLLADDLVALLEERAPHLRAVTPPEDWQRARRYGRTATGLLRYHSWMADDSPARLTRLVSVRDHMMAGNLLDLAERGPGLVSAHNGHMQRDLSSMAMDSGPVAWWSAGALVSDRLGADYAFLATALGTLRHRGVDVPPPDTAEGVLYRFGADRCLVGAAELAAVLRGAAGQAPPAPRVSAYFGYAPLDPAHLPRIDGVVFVRDVAPEP